MDKQGIKTNINLLEKWLLTKEENIDKIIYREAKERFTEKEINDAKKVWVGFHVLYEKLKENVYTLAAFYREFDIYANFLTDLLKKDEDFIKDIRYLNADYKLLKNEIVNEINKIHDEEEYKNKMGVLNQ